MSDFMYRAAYRYLLMPEDRNFRLMTLWNWSMEGTAMKPIVRIEWSVEGRNSGGGFGFLASGSTFEVALIRLAAKLAVSTQAKEIGVAFMGDDLSQLCWMDQMADYRICLENVEKNQIEVSAYGKDGTRLSVSGRTFKEAETSLINSMGGRRVQRLENPQRFYSQWRYMEKRLGDPWKGGRCLQMVAAVNPITGSVNPDVPAANTEIRTFLFDPGSRGTSVSAVSFEEALNRFARSLGWKP